MHPDLAGVHFTGSTPTFQHLWRTVGDHLEGYRSYPRLVGETGGKDFVIAHPSADVDALRVGLVRGAFEYQGQKCSAASRAYIAESVWRRLRDDLAADVAALPMGDVTRLLATSWARSSIGVPSTGCPACSTARATDPAAVRARRRERRPTSVGYFVSPTVLLGTDPTHEVFTDRVLRPDPQRLRLRRRGLRLGR